MSNDRRQINDSELDVLFSLIGQSIWYLQNVEDALNTCITIKGEIKKIGTISEEEAENILTKHRRNTLGTSLRIAKEKNILSKNLLAVLYEFREERDWLVHRSVHQNGDDLYQDSKRYALILRIRKFTDDALVLQNLISKELEDFVVAQGVSKEWIYNHANETISKKRGKGL